MSTRIHTRIEIQAPASLVWNLLVDLDGYHRWNPFIPRARGRISPGALLEVSPGLTDRRKTTFRPDVTSYVEGAEFAWTGAIGPRWFARGVHRFRLEPIAADRVRVDHDETLLGIGGPLVGLLAGSRIERGFTAMNAALKREAEARFSGVAKP